VKKAQLVDIMSEKANLTKAAAAKALEAFMSAVTAALMNREQVSLIGFGTFESKIRAARTGRNPKTGDVLQIPEALVPVFKAGKGLKDAVASGEMVEETTTAQEA
jgi:DNA-binding protein HU-beta